MVPLIHSAPALKNRSTTRVIKPFDLLRDGSLCTNPFNLLDDLWQRRWLLSWHRANALCTQQHGLWAVQTRSHTFILFLEQLSVNQQTSVYVRTPEHCLNMSQVQLNWSISFLNTYEADYDKLKLHLHFNNVENSLFGEGIKYLWLLHQWKACWESILI